MSEERTVFDEETGEPMRRVSVPLKGRSDADIAADVEELFQSLEPKAMTTDAHAAGVVAGEELAQRLADLARNASGGIWHVCRYGDDDSESLVIHHDDVFRVCFMATPGGSASSASKIEANADLICELRNNLPTILAALRSSPDYERGCVAGVQESAEVARARGAIEWRGISPGHKRVCDELAASIEDLAAPAEAFVWPDPDNEATMRKVVERSQVLTADSMVPIAPPASANGPEIAGLIARLNAKRKVAPTQGSGSISSDGKVTFEMWDNGERLVNPDGPEAASALTAFRAREDAYREALAKAAKHFDVIAATAVIRSDPALEQRANLWAGEVRTALSGAGDV